MVGELVLKKAPFESESSAKHDQRILYQLPTFGTAASMVKPVTGLGRELLVTIVTRMAIAMRSDLYASCVLWSG